MRRLAVSILAVLAVALPAQADARSWRLSSPGGQVTVGVRGAAGAPLSATVRHAGTRVLDLRIGLRAGGRCLPQGLRYRGSARARVDERYTHPRGQAPRPPLRRAPPGPRLPQRPHPGGGAAPGVRRRRRLAHDRRTART